MVTYKKNFLSNVIFRIDFSPILKLEKEKPADFQDKIQHVFPILEPINQLGLSFVIDQKQESNSKMENLSRITWKFLSEDKKKIIELDSNYLAISFLEESYKNYTDFKACVEEIIRIFYEAYPEVIAQRMGLRYINEIKIKEDNLLEWGEYINSKLISNISFFAEKEKIRRAMNVAILKLDSFTLNFNYGIFNSSFPGEIVSKEYILDYDCFTSGQIDKGGIGEKMDFCNIEITKIFEESITDDFRAILNN